jgi:phage terminase large subunit GpA-like protein
MEKFRMADILHLLPFETPPKGRSAFYVPCPHCDRRGRKKDKHLNINLIKDCFRCAILSLHHRADN